MKILHVLYTLAICTAVSTATYATTMDYSDDSMGCGVKFVNADNRPMQCVYPMGSLIIFNDPDIFETKDIYVPGLSPNQDLVPEPEFEQQLPEYLN